MNRRSRIFVAGGDTLAGAALLERLRAAGCRRLVGAPPHEPDLADPVEVRRFFKEMRPEAVFLVAGRSGGIGLNVERPADLMLDNLLVAANVLRESHRRGVGRLLYLASSCAYPKHAPQPLAVEFLMTGPLEPTSEAYAAAKLAGWQLCRAYRRQYGVRFITAFPANPFGPHDDFTAAGGHVVPALIRRAHEAMLRDEPTLTVWGSGAARREFLFARDLADACLFLLRRYDDEPPINIGSGVELTIAEVAAAVAEAVGYRGRIVFDASRPDGAPRKALDSRPLRALGWRARTTFAAALAETYHWFLQHRVTEDLAHGHATL